MEIAFIDTLTLVLHVRPACETAQAIHEVKVATESIVPGLKLCASR